MARKPKSETIAIEKLSEEHSTEIEDIRSEVECVTYDIGDLIDQVRNANTLQELRDAIESCKSTLEEAVSSFEDCETRAETVADEIDNPDED